MLPVLVRDLFLQFSVMRRVKSIVVYKTCLVLLMIDVIKVIKVHVQHFINNHINNSLNLFIKITRNYWLIKLKSNN